MWEYNDLNTLRKAQAFKVADLTSRKILRFLRKNLWLTDFSKGRVKVESVGEDIEIIDKNSGRPLICLNYRHDLS